MKIPKAFYLVFLLLAGCEQVRVDRNKKANRLEYVAAGRLDSIPRGLQEKVIEKCMAYMFKRLRSECDVKGVFSYQGHVIGTREINSPRQHKGALQVIKYRITQVAHIGNHYIVIVHFGDVGSIHAFKFLHVRGHFLTSEHFVALGD